jgi:putative endonuclease
MSYAVYIIYSPLLDKYYVGYSQNVDARLAQHNSGISDFSAKASDWVLKHVEHFETRELAMKRERQIKNKKSRKYIEWLVASAR